jgi:SAM-dependent methyltransferase
MANTDYNDPHNAQCDEVVAFIRGTEARAAFDGGRATRVLELGCGTGPFGRRLLAEYPAITVTGVDVLPQRIETLSRFLVEQKLVDRYRALVGDALDPALFAPGSFDVVLAPSVLHHFERLALSPVPPNLHRWLRPGGYLVIQDPNGANPVQQLSNQVMRVAARHVKSLRCYKCPDETMYTPAYFKRVFGGCGFESLACQVGNPLLPVRGSGVPLLGLHHALNNLVAHVTWGDWHGCGQLQLFRRD